MIRQHYLTIILAVLFILGLLCVFILFNNNSLLFNFYNTAKYFFAHHHNMSVYPVVNKTNPLLFGYGLLAIIFLASGLGKLMWKKIAPLTIVWRAALFILFALIILQNTGIIGITANLLSPHPKINTSFFVLSQTSAQARFFKEKYPGHHSGALLTDMDTTRDPGMYMQSLLAYFLYPLDIRDVRPIEKTFIIAFNKHDAQKFIPDGYTIVGIWDSQNLIAVKANYVVD